MSTIDKVTNYFGMKSSVFGELDTFQKIAFSGGLPCILWLN
jgi:hypothetical protein